MLWQMLLDRHLHEVAQVIGVDRVELNTDIAKTLGPGVGLFCWSSRETPFADLLSGDGKSFRTPSSLDFVRFFVSVADAADGSRLSTGHSMHQS